MSQAPKLMEGGNYIMEGMKTKAKENTFLIFSMDEEVGALARALKIFQVFLYSRSKVFTVHDYA